MTIVMEKRTPTCTLLGDADGKKSLSTSPKRGEVVAKRTLSCPCPEHVTKSSPQWAINTTRGGIPSSGS